jgi:signal transduction histidine kinase
VNGGRGAGIDSADSYPSAPALVSRLALRAAHDLNNLIAVISGHVYLLRASVEKPGSIESLDAMQTAVAGLERLSRSLSAVGTAHGPAGAVDLEAVLRGVAAEPGAPPAEIEIEERLPPVAGSAEALRAALRALVANAAAAAPDAPIRIAARRDGGDGVVLSVEDRGAGVAPEAAARAFDPFYSTRNGGRGTGIGLFVAAAVAAAHGTTCVLQPRDGGGTVASMRLRLA